MRMINERFINDLKSGSLAFFLDQVKNKSNELCLEIRDGYVNIYYRGGNLLRITQKTNGYCFYFDAKYCLNKGDDTNYELFKVASFDDIGFYVKHFALMVEEMNTWLKKHPKSEREFQHKLLAKNSQIVDIEYATPKSKVTGEKLNMRLDMLMVDGDKLIIVENKYGTGAITGSAGIRKHYEDICKLMNTADVYDEMIESVTNIAKAKCELGLLDTPIEKLDKSKTEILFLLADFNEKSETLKNELSEINAVYAISVLKMNAADSVIDLNKAERI